MDAKVTVGISASLLNISLWESDARKNIQAPFSSSQTTFVSFLFEFFFLNCSFCMGFVFFF